MSASRDMAVVDTFYLPEEAQASLVAETVRIMRRAALERAITVAKRAARKVDMQRHQESPTAEREHRRALEAVLVAAETYLGTNETEED